MLALAKRVTLSFTGQDTTLVIHSKNSRGGGSELTSIMGPRGPDPFPGEADTETGFKKLIKGKFRRRTKLDLNWT